MSLVKRKGNTKAKVDVEKFDEIKKLFHQDIRNVTMMDEVPVELMINWDQTSLNYIPVSQWTMAQEGAKWVEIDGKDDKRQQELGGEGAWNLHSLPGAMTIQINRQLVSI